jgi:hypothetical protein
LLGVAATGITSSEVAEQLKIGERPDRWRTADRAMDTLRRRFGGDAVDRAALADRKPVRGRPSETDPRTGSSEGKGRAR